MIKCNDLTKDISEVFFSGHQITEVYIGTSKVFPESDPTPPTPYENEYFTMVVTTGGDIKFSGSTTANTLSYSRDNGQTWTTANSATTIALVAGDKVLWKGTPTPQAYYGIGKFSGATTVRYSVEGNTMSLLYGDDFVNQTSLSGNNYAFYHLFDGNTNVTSAENLVLPATTLAGSCYGSMFFGCTSLTTAPELPATTLVDWCYAYMFERCSSLTTAPELPATTLADDCYYGMFRGCASLKTAPELPSTTLTYQCYRGMFSGCTSLTTASELPATTLVERCYEGMFQDCPSLTTSPVLSATTLARECYRDMFTECTSLTTAPVLPATSLVERCYQGMFSGCTTLTTASELPATTLANYCYSNMFERCSSLNYIKCLATNITASGCTADWVNGVASSGTFVKAASMTGWPTGSNGIPSGWTIQNT